MFAGIESQTRAAQESAMKSMSQHLVLLSLSLAACTAGDVDPDPEPDPGLAILGGNTHTASSVNIDTFLSSSDLNEPMDLAFHNINPNELWVVNQGDNSMTTIGDVTAESWSATNRRHPTADHFMAKPSALAFGTGNRMATAQEEDETTPYTNNAPGDFMGPTIFTATAADFDGGHGSHYDMLHNSPSGAGIAWEADNVYWIFDGSHNSLTRYNFNEDHGSGGTDHSDAEVLRYVEGEVGYERGVGSHMVYKADTEMLYVADTSNARIAVLDTTTGTVGSTYGPNYDGGTQNKVTGATLTTLIDETSGLQKPAGLALHDDMLFVVDHATSTIWAFDLDGEVVDYLETGIAENSLMGIDFDSQGQLYVTNVAENQVIRISSL